MKLLGSEALAAFQKAGMDVKYKKMPNGEQRYALTLPWGGFTVTIAGPNGGWQDAHSHPQVEDYEVVEGAMIMAMVMEDHNPHLEAMNDMFTYVSGDQVSVPSGRAHNVFLTPGTIIHTASIRGDEPASWDDEPALDAWSKSFDTLEKVLAHGLVPSA